MIYITDPYITSFRLKIRFLVAILGFYVYAIVNDRLSALELAITPDMGHDGWANDVTLSNILERSLFTLRFLLYKNSKVSIETP